MPIHPRRSADFNSGNGNAETQPTTTSNHSTLDGQGRNLQEGRAPSPLPGPSSRPDNILPMTLSEENQLTPTKILNNISPLPIRTKPQMHKRKKINATNLTSKDNIKKLKLKQEEKEKKSKSRSTGKNVRKKGVKPTDTSDSSDSSAEVEFREESSDGILEKEEECVGCGEDYFKTKKNCDWIQCVRCMHWLHESCTLYVDVCHRCGNAILKKK